MRRGRSRCGRVSHATGSRTRRRHCRWRTTARSDRSRGRCGGRSTSARRGSRTARAGRAARRSRRTAAWSRRTRGTATAGSLHATAAAAAAMVGMLVAAPAAAATVMAGTGSARRGGQQRSSGHDGQNQGLAKHQRSPQFVGHQRRIHSENTTCPGLRPTIAVRQQSEATVSSRQFAQLPI